MASPQQIIGHYRILSKLGEGGMGEVWRATDTRLNREVAIKVLPAGFADDAMRMGRFAREAQVLASLNHPGIAAIYGVEEHALVTELVEGATLAERIARGRIPPDEALPIATQIAEALEYAHEKGVIHRDLKPANIKITPEGRVKILDFGLAKAMSVELSASASAEAATLSSPATMAGTILGTAAYMSPEQARGQNVDRRADIWAFGCVFYEMLTGNRAFPGENVSDTLASLLAREPDLSGLPRPARDVIALSLQKEARLRWQAIGDVRLALAEDLLLVPAAAKRSGGLARVVAAGVGLAAMTACLAFWLGARGARQRSDDVMRFAISLPENGTVGGVALSPDGRQLIIQTVYPNLREQLWLRRLDSVEAVPLAGTDGATFPFWSPDNRWIGFGQGGRLKKMDLAGGPPIPLADAPFFCGGSWSTSGLILFAPKSSGPLYEVASAGGTATPATRLDPAAQASSHRWPWFLPDGLHFLFDAGNNGTDHADIYLGSLDTRAPGAVTKIVADANSNAMYASGHLLFLRGTTLMAQPFDLATSAAGGNSVPVANSVVGSTTSALGKFTVSGDGKLVYLFGEPENRVLAWFDRAGRNLGAVGESGVGMGRIFLSPDNQHATVDVANETSASGGADLWIYDLGRNVRSRFTSGHGDDDDYGIWSHDGSQIAYAASNAGRFNILRKPANGASGEERLYSGAGSVWPTSWSPDGKWLLFGKPDDSLWALPLDGDRKPVRWAIPGQNGQFSPDGRWAAYQSNESGSAEIFVAPFPGPGGKFLVSKAGGALPRWRGDGKEIFYVSHDHSLMSAEVSLEPAAAIIGAVRPLFGPILVGSGFSYDAAADGQRFLVVMEKPPSAPRSLTAVLSWPATLKK